FSLFSFTTLQPRRSTLFPYTTLFRSRSTTFTTRIFNAGRCSRRIDTAASVSSVGTSPAQAITSSGSLPRSLLAQSHTLMPLVQRSEEHTSELQSLAYLVCRLLLEKKK